MTRPTISINILTFGIPEFLDLMLASLMRAGVPAGIPVRVYEDKCPDYHQAEKMSAEYKRVCEKYQVEYRRTPIWGCCQGNAQYAAMNSKEDWLIMLGDDLLITPGCPQSWIDRIINQYDASSAGLVFVSWWDSERMVDAGVISHKRDVLADGFLSKELHLPGGFAADPGVLYANVHGSGFVMRRKMWEEVGGFSQGTWVWDEDISFRCWMFSRYNIFSSPGPTAVHYMGQSNTSFAKYPQVFDNIRNKTLHDTFGNEESWTRTWGLHKDVTNPLFFVGICEAMRISGGAFTLDKCQLRDKPLSDKIKNWAAVSAAYRKSTDGWFSKNDVATLGL